MILHSFDTYVKWLNDKIMQDAWERGGSEYQQPITDTYNQASRGPSEKQHSTSTTTYAIRATVIKCSTDRERKMNEREEVQMDDKHD